jgi:hypothetical protein
MNSKPLAAPLSQPDKKPCPDCLVLPDGTWRCDMNCGPCVPVVADPLGIEAARRIVGGHSKLTRQLIKAEVAAPLPEPTTKCPGCDGVGCAACDGTGAQCNGGMAHRFLPISSGGKCCKDCGMQRSVIPIGTIIVTVILWIER